MYFISRGVKLRPSGRRYKPHRVSDFVRSNCSDIITTAVNAIGEY